MERFVAAMVSGRRDSIFPWVVEEVEGKGAQVKDSLGTNLI